MRIVRSLPILLITALAPSLASAQIPARPEPAVPVEKIVVTEKLLTESPATVTRIELGDLPATENTTAKLAMRAANFFAGANDAHSFNDTFALRGLTNTPIFGDPAISFYLDDLPLGGGFTFPSDLSGFAHAELHRGPSQNTVFGRAGSAGVVTLLTPQPGAAPTGELRASFGNYSAKNLSASVMSAADARLDAYVSAAYATRDGYIKNTTLNRDIDDKDSRSALARFRIRPSTSSELTLLVTTLRARDGVQPLVPLGGPLFTVTRKNEGQTSVDATNAALKAAFTTPFGLLSATTSRTDWELGPYANALAFGPSELLNTVGQTQRNWNEEVKLASLEKSPVRWQVGAIYTDGRTDGAFTRAFGPFIIEKSAYRVDARDHAAFGEATFKLTPDLSLTAGARAEDSRKELDRRATVPAAASGSFAFTRESTALLPKLSLSYALDRATTAFASVGAGYKPGGFSAFTGTRALASFGPERTKTFETGLTSATSDKTVTATLRLFYYDITGYQIERSFATSAVADDYIVVNAPRARSYGGELELAWKPFPALTVSADLGTTDVTLREFTDPYTGLGYTGKRAPYVPAYDASLRLDYALAEGFFAGVELSSNGRTYYTESEDLTFGQKSYCLVSAHLGYAIGRTRLSVYGENLTDEGYYSAISPGTFHGTPGAPRTYGVEVRLKW